ncbi:MAG TPA: OmpA family protein [Candidatus Omnitrophota bacterium]|nr:OmpA family protein [Candidatus Omnitrophota bacterium]HPT07616.1 OmpA family protein [Candidatus Omnitrophota bacterium]
MSKRILPGLLSILFIFSLTGCAADRAVRRQAEIDQTQKEFNWWPTDAKPAPVKDRTDAGYWWWPNQPGQAKPWGNRGYCYVYKIIFDYQADELPAPKPQEMRKSLVIKKIIKNVKIYFDYNKSGLRKDGKEILNRAVKTLGRNPEANILITGNCDIRGSENYNDKLGKKRATSVENFMVENGVDASRIKIISRGKLDAVAHIQDIEGMQKDRNAQFMIAEVEEVMMPYEGTAPAEPNVITQTQDNKVVEESHETIESSVKVSTKEYTIKKNDSLWSIAQQELGSGHRWKYLYQINKDRIKNPNKLKAGTRIIIPLE